MPRGYINPMFHDLEKTIIPQFYRGRNVLIIGGTGFLGKVLIQRLLVGCPLVKSIMLVVDKIKHGTDVEQIRKKLSEDLAFSKIKPEERETLFNDKVKIILAQYSMPLFGLESQLRSPPLSMASIVFHLSGSTELNFYRDVHLSSNFESIQKTVGICKHLNFFKILLYVSTSRYIGGTTIVPERGVNIDKICRVLGNKMQLDYKVKPSKIDSWKDMHTFTKFMAEHYLNNLCPELSGPIIILRPGMITGSREEPFVGYDDAYSLNRYKGFTGIVAAAMQGIIRSKWADPSNVVPLVPVDYVANMIIIATWHMLSDDDAPKPSKLNESQKKENRLTINYVAPKRFCLTWRLIQRYLSESERKYPTMKAVWTFSFKVKPIYKYLLDYVSYDWFPGFILFWVLRFNLTIWSCHKCKGFLCIPWRLNCGTCNNKICKYTPFNSLDTDMNKLKEATLLLDHVKDDSWDHKTDNARRILDLLKSKSMYDHVRFPTDLQTIAWDDYFDGLVMAIRKHFFKDQTDYETARRSIFKMEHQFATFYNAIVAVLVGVAFVIWAYNYIYLIRPDEDENEDLTVGFDDSAVFSRRV